MAARQFVQQLDDQRRDELIRATYHEVAEKGYSAVTLQDIATRAGLSKGATLYYFASKEDLFLAALEWMVEQNHARIEQAVNAVDNAIEKVRAAINIIFANAQQSRQFFLAYCDFVSIGTRNKRFHDLNARFYHDCTRVDRRIIELGIETGVFRKVNLDDASSMSRALIDGLMLQWFFSSDGTFEEYRCRCERIILNYLTFSTTEPVSS
jgi:AcrR family transcriptional regulator